MFFGLIIFVSVFNFCQFTKIIRVICLFTAKPGIFYREKRFYSLLLFFLGGIVVLRCLFLLRFASFLLTKIFRIARVFFVSVAKMLYFAWKSLKIEWFFGFCYRLFLPYFWADVQLFTNNIRIILLLFFITRCLFWLANALFRA